MRCMPFYSKQLVLLKLTAVMETELELTSINTMFYSGIIILPQSAVIFMLSHVKKYHGEPKLNAYFKYNV